MEFLPLGKRVVVKREEITTTKTGLIIPDSAKEKPATGKVVALSNHEEIKNHLNIGDTVMFSKYSGTEVINPSSGESLLVLDIDDIFCKIK